MSQKTITKAFEAALKMQSEAAELGFDWHNAAPVIDKAKEELDELLLALEKGDQQSIYSEFGDLLFVMANLSRHLDASIADSLFLTNEKFEKRFSFVKERASENNVEMHQSNLDMLERYWNEAKDFESK